MINIGTILAALRLSDESAATIKAAIGNFAGLQQQVNQTTAQMGSVKPAVDDVTDAVTKAGNASRTAGFQMTVLGRGAQEAGMLLTAGLTLPLLAIGKTVVETGSEFEKQMTRVVTLAGATSAELGFLKKGVLELAPAVGVGPSELAKGLYVLTSYGYDASKSMEVLKTTAQMSALGMGDMTQTSIALTGALFAYKEQNLTAGDAANVLIKAVKYGNMEISSLIPAISKVNPLAAALGVSFQDVASTIAVFTRSGADASVAATGLRAMLSNILTDSAKTEKGFAALARATGDNTINMANFRRAMKEDGLSAALLDLMESATKAGDAGVEALNKIFPNVRALTTALSVFKTNGGDVVDVMAKMNNGFDDLGNGTKELEKTWAFQWDQMKIAIETLWIALSESLLPIFKNVLDSFKSFIPVIRNVIEGFNSLPPLVQSLALTFGALLMVIGPTLIILGQFGMAVGNITRGLSVLGLTAGSSPFIAFLSNPWVLGAAAAFIAIGVAISYSTETSAKSAAQSIETTTNHLREYDTLLKLQKELWQTVGTSRTLNQVTEDYIKIAPREIGLLDDLKLTHDQLEAKIMKTVGAKKEMLQADLAVLAIDKKKLEQDQLDLKAQMARVNTFLQAGPSEGMPTSQIDSFSAKYKELRAELDLVDATLVKNAETYDILRRVLDPTHAALRKQEEAAAALKKANDEVNRTNTEGLKINQTIYEQMMALTEVQRAEIQDLVNKKYRISDISKETQIATAVVALYVNSLKGEAAAHTAVEKAAKKANEAKEATDRVNALLAAQGITIASVGEEWAKAGLKVGASVADVVKATGKSEGAVTSWNKAIKAANADHEKYAKDMVTAETKIAAVTAETASLQIKATGETFEAKRAMVDKWFIEELAAVNKLRITNQTYQDYVVALALRAAAAKAAITADEVTKHNAVLADLKSEEEKFSEETLALWEKAESIKADLQMEGAEKEIRLLQAQAIKAEAINQKHLDDMIAKIKANADALGQVEMDQQIQSAQNQANARSVAIQGVLQLQTDLANVNNGIAKNLEEALKGIPKIIMDAFTGGGGLIGAVKAIGVSLMNAFVEPFIADLGRILSQAVANAMIRAKAAGQVAGASGSMIGPESNGAQAGTTAAAGSGSIVGAVAAAGILVVAGLTRYIMGNVAEVKAAEKAYKDFKDSLIATYGSMEKLGTIASLVGIDLAAITDTKSLEQLKAGVNEIEERWRMVTDAVDKYGISLADVGYQTAAFLLSAKADDVRKSWDGLFMAGVDASTAVKAMAPDIYAIIKLYEEAGVAIPENLQAVIDQLRIVEEAEGGVIRSAKEIKEEFDRDIKDLNDLFVQLGTAAATTGQKMPAQFDDAVLKLQELGLLSEEAAQAIMGMQEGATVDFKAMETAAEKYKISLHDLGPAFKQAKIDDTAKTIWEDFQLLTNNGADVDAVLKGMGKSISELVSDATKFGTTIPEQFRPLLEKLIKSGELLDDNGEKITDLKDIKFGAPIVSEFDKLVSKIDELILKLADGLGLSLLEKLPKDAKEGIFDVNREIGELITDIPPIKITFDVEPPNLPPIPSDSDNEQRIPANASGTRNFIGGWTMVGERGPEAVHLPRGADILRNGVMPDGGGGTQIVIQAWDGNSVDQWLRSGGAEQLAEAMVPAVPGVVNRHGLRRR